MALSTGFWLFIIFFTHFIHGIATVFGAWFAWMRGAGKWGGGIEAIDYRACPQGKVSRVRILKKRGLYAQYAGGSEVVMTEIRGLWGKKDIRMKQGDIINLFLEQGGPLLIGRDQIMSGLDREESRKDEMITRLWQENLALMDDLTHKTHNVDEIVDKYTKKFQELGKAFPFGGGQKSSTQTRTRR